MSSTNVIQILADEAPGNRGRVLKFLIENHGKCFTRREMTLAIGFRSPAPLLSCLRHLEEEGKIRRFAQAS